MKKVIVTYSTGLDADFFNSIEEFEDICNEAIDERCRILHEDDEMLILHHDSPCKTFLPQYDKRC